MFTYQFSETGLSHALTGRENQDALAVSAHGDTAFVFVADGMGSARRGGEAARAAVDAAAALVPWTYLPAEAMRAPSLGFSVRAAFPIAYNALIGAADKGGWDTRDMLTTFMCVGFDARTGRLEYGFCGDGGIVALTKDGKVRLLTRAAKGALAGQTTPLNSFEGWLFGSCEDVRAFLVMTDGLFDRLCPGGVLPRSLSPEGIRLRKILRGLLRRPERMDPAQLRIVLDNALSSARPVEDELGRLVEGVSDDRSLVLISAGGRGRS